MLRRVWSEPGVTCFRPAGRAGWPEEAVLALDEFEAVRLKDYEGLTQTRAAERMGVSQPTFQRVYLSARKKIADALVNGKIIRIEGGRCRIMRRRFRGRGMLRMRGIRRF